MQGTYRGVGVRGGALPVLDIEERAAAEKVVARDGLKLALLVWLAVRLALSGWGALVTVAGNAQSLANARQAYPDVTWPNRDLYGMTVGVWNIYDTQHYITIAERGYEADPLWLPAYFPGFPLLIKAARLFTLGDSLLAGMLIANLSAIIFFWYLYRMVEPEYGASAARRSVVVSAVFPSAFFLFMGYVEATFLACVVAAFYYAGQKRWWLAGLLGGYAALTKQPGVFLAVPFAYMYLSQYGTWRQWPVWRPLALLKRLDWLWLLLIPASAAAYTLYRYLYIKAPIAGAGDMGGQQEIEFPGTPLLKALGVMKPGNPLLGLNIMDVAFTLLMVALVAGVLWKVPSVPLRLYSVMLLIANLSLTMYTYPLRPEVNMPRRGLIIFPIFIFLGVTMQGSRPFRYVAAASLLAFLFLSSLFVLWVFVS